MDSYKGGTVCILFGSVLNSSIQKIRIRALVSRCKWLEPFRIYITGLIIGKEPSLGVLADS